MLYSLYYPFKTQLVRSQEYRINRVMMDKCKEYMRCTRRNALPCTVCERKINKRVAVGHELINYIDTKILSSKKNYQ